MLRLMDHQTKQLFPGLAPPLSVHNIHDLSRVPPDQIITGQHGHGQHSLVSGTNITSHQALTSLQLMRDKDP